jgi:hypothetical protein
LATRIPYSDTHVKHAPSLFENTFATATEACTHSKEGLVTGWLVKNVSISVPLTYNSSGGTVSGSVPDVLWRPIRQTRFKGVLAFAHSAGSLVFRADAVASRTVIHLLHDRSVNHETFFVTDAVSFVIQCGHRVWTSSFFG